MTAVLGDARVALYRSPELRPDVDGAAGGVVAEEDLQLAPEVVRGVVRRLDHVVEFIGDRGVDPEYDGNVIVPPDGICMQGVSSFLDVILDLVLGQYKGEELAPFRVIVGVQAELEGDELGRDINVMHGWRRSDGDLGGRRCQGERTAGSSWGAQGRWSARAEDRGADGRRSNRSRCGGRRRLGGDAGQVEDGVGVPKGAGAPERAADAHGEGGSERIESV